MRYQSDRPTRRFLAGVACPSCQAMDAVVQVTIVTPMPDEYIECTQCGHRERRPEADDVKAANSLANDAMSTGTSGTVKFKP